MTPNQPNNLNHFIRPIPEIRFFWLYPSIAFDGRWRLCKRDFAQRLLKGTENTMRRFRWLLAAASAVVAGLIAATVAKRRTQRAAMSTVTAVDLARYAGRWYEVARLPNEFQKKCAGDVSADYNIRPDGKVDVVNQCRQEDGTINVARGVARSADSQTNAKLEVRFAPAFLSWLPAIWGDYWVIGLDENYRWAVVGAPTRKYGWILSRTPEIAAVDWNAAVAVLQDNAYNPTLFIRTIHAVR